MRTVTTAEEVGNVFMGKPHVVLLGAGASRAALPNGDRNGRPVPLLQEIAADLELADLFPASLQDLARTGFEAAYSRLISLDPATARRVEQEVSDYFSMLELPDEANLYDVLSLSLRDKDAIFTFNWDPFLMQSRERLAALGAGPRLPKLFFLHGNVRTGFCDRDKVAGLIGARCSSCGEPFLPSQLLFPVERKHYQDGSFIENEWAAMRHYLKRACWFTVFGYSAPTTDVEAVDLLKAGWGGKEERAREQFEIICRPGADQGELRSTWQPFLHSPLHYSIHESFRESWLGRHPRRSGEAHWYYHYEAWQVEDNPVPEGLTDLGDLVAWFEQFRAAEEAEASSRP